MQHFMQSYCPVPGPHEEPKGWVSWLECPQPWLESQHHSLSLNVWSVELVPNGARSLSSSSVGSQHRVAHSRNWPPAYVTGLISPSTECLAVSQFGKGGEISPWSRLTSEA